MAERPVATEWQILGGKLKAQPEPGVDAEDQVFALGIRSGCKLDGLRVEEAPVADIADARRVQSCKAASASERVQRWYLRRPGSPIVGDLDKGRGLRPEAQHTRRQAAGRRGVLAGPIRPLDGDLCRPCRAHPVPLGSGKPDVDVDLIWPGDLAGEESTYGEASDAPHQFLRKRAEGNAVVAMCRPRLPVG